MREPDSLHFRLWAAVAAVLLPLPALADLMLYPTRIELEKNARGAQVELVNQGQTTESYRILLVNRRMTDTGQITEANTTGAGEAFADHMLRYSPRQVTLRPGESQTVRISLRKPADLPAGEYRSHLQFDRLPDAQGATDLAYVVQPEPGQMAIHLTALVGASIPVIVRQGDTTATVTLDRLVLEPAAIAADNSEQAAQLAFNMNRSGNRSAYGNLLLTYTPPGGKPLEVGRINGVAVYVPNLLRIAKLPLTLPAGVVLKGGMLSLTYAQRPEDGSKVLAQVNLPVP
jgi:hypothetical protein